MACFDTDINIPNPPASPNPINDWDDLVANLVTSQAGLAGYNLEDVARIRSEEEATRQAFEQTMGIPYTDYLAQSAVQEARLKQSAMDRYGKALRGELPVSPALETQLHTQGQQLGEKFNKQIGPGYETSTPYLEAKRQFDTLATGLRTASQEGAISSAEQLGYASPVAPITQINKLTSLQTPGQFGSLMDLYKFNLAQQNQAALTGYNQRVGAELASSQNQSNLMTGGLNLLGTLGGLYFGGSALGLF